MSTSLGPTFPKLFAAALLQEVSFVMMIHFPGFLSRLGVNEGRIGLLYAGAALVGLLARPGLGKLLDVTHRRTVLLWSGICNAVVMAVLAATGVWGPALWLVFLAHRLLQEALFTTMLTYAADAIPLHRRTQGLALFGLSGLVPISIGGAVGDLVISGWGFPALFLVSAGAALTSWLLVWRLPLLPVLGHRPRRNFFAAMMQRDLLPVWLITLAFGIGMQTLFTFTRTYVDTRGIGSAGLFFGVYGAVAALTRLLGGRWYDRIPHRALVTTAVVVYSAGLAVMAVAGSTPPLVLAAFMGGAAHGISFPVLSSQIVNRARTAERGSAISIFTSIFGVALLVTGPVVGGLIDVSGYTVALAAVAGTLAVGAVGYARWDRRLVGVSA